MKLNIMGGVLGVSSGSYVALISWTISHIGSTPLYLALAISSGITLLVTALCGLVSGRKVLWRRMALMGIIVFGTIGVLLAMPTITMTMLAVDNKTQECFLCDPLAGDKCDSLCNAYKDIHVALFVLTLLESLVGSLLVSGACYAVCPRRGSRHSSSIMHSSETVETFVSTSTV